MVQISDKNSSHSGVCVQGEWQKYTPSSPPFSRDEGLKEIGHSMSIENLILGVNSVTVLYFIHYDSLLQNATDLITKCNNYFITKCDRSLLQNASGFLLQNATVLLQNATVIIKCYVFTSCDSVSSQSKYEIKDSKTIYLDLTVMSKKINRTLAIEQRFPCRVSL